MKGIILAGGKGTRLQPATFAMNKHMVPILNKPMILYPLETLKRLGIEEILIVSGGNHLGAFADFLGDGSEYGVKLTYKVQKEAGGIAQALGLAEDFAAGESVAVILGDNVFDNQALSGFIGSVDRAHLFVKEVKDPNRFGVLVEIEGKKHIFEKPTEDVGNKAVTGLYIYPNKVFEIIPTLVPSDRGELEITDVNNYFLNDAVVNEIGGFWSDAGTPESLATVTAWEYERRSKK